MEKNRNELLKSEHSRPNCGDMHFLYLCADGFRIQLYFPLKNPPIASALAYALCAFDILII